MSGNPEMLECPFYLTIGADKVRGKWVTHARITKTAPGLGAREIAVRMNLAVPVALFERPALAFNLTIPATEATVPVVDAEVAKTIAESIQRATGYGARVTVEHAGPAPTGAS